jgi:hypothetical protein
MDTETRAYLTGVLKTLDELSASIRLKIAAPAAPVVYIPRERMPQDPATESTISRVSFAGRNARIQNDQASTLSRVSVSRPLVGASNIGGVVESKGEDDRGHVSLDSLPNWTEGLSGISRTSRLDISSP